MNIRASHSDDALLQSEESQSVSDLDNSPNNYISKKTKKIIITNAENKE